MSHETSVYACLFSLIHVSVCSIEIKMSYFIHHIERLRRFSLHDAVQELCDKTEDLELNENFFTEKLDQIRNKFKRVSNS